MKLISAILPVYNAELFLSDAIQSILAQSYSEFELIIVNDGSNDKSNEVIESFLFDDRIKYINRAENKGLVFSLNEALACSKGSFIARMDADDISHPDRFKIQLDFLIRNPQIKLVGTSYKSFDSKGFIKLNSHPSNPIEIAYKFLSDTFFCHPSVMFRSELITELGDYEDAEAEDYRFFSKIVNKYPCSNINMPLIYYREHTNNRSLSHKNELRISVLETSKSNIGLLIKSDKLQNLYFLHRNSKLTKINELLLAVFLDFVVVIKILSRYQVRGNVLDTLVFLFKLYGILFSKLLNLIKRKWL